MGGGGGAVTADRATAVAAFLALATALVGGPGVAVGRRELAVPLVGAALPAMEAKAVGVAIATAVGGVRLAVAYAGGASANSGAVVASEHVDALAQLAWDAAAAVGPPPAGGAAPAAASGATPPLPIAALSSGHRCGRLRGRRRAVVGGSGGGRGRRHGGSLRRGRHGGGGGCRGPR